MNEDLGHSINEKEIKSKLRSYGMLELFKKFSTIAISQRIDANRPRFAAAICGEFCIATESDGSTLHRIALTFFPKFRIHVITRFSVNCRL
jgi:hypothetical protein